MNQWKKQAVESLPEVFSLRRVRVAAEEEALKDQLYQQIGQLKVELDWLKKKLACPVEQKRYLVEPAHEQRSVHRQGERLGLARASYYYAPRPVSAEKLRLMNLLDEQYTKTRWGAQNDRLAERSKTRNGQR